MSDQQVPGEQPTTTRTVKRHNIPWLSIIALTIAIISILAAGFILITTNTKQNQLDNRITALEVRMFSLSTEVSVLNKTEIDMTTKSFQNIGGNFAVSIESVDAHLTGFNITGMVLNENATKNSDVKFQVTMGSAMQQLNIPIIDSGYAANFKLYMPDITADQTKTATFAYQSSNVSFSSQ